MRKIKVSGCLNYPYWMQKGEKKHYCRHPSFARNKIDPNIPDKYINDLINGVEYTMCSQEYMPSWCPLEYDGLVSVSQLIKC